MGLLWWLFALGMPYEGLATPNQQQRQQVIVHDTTNYGSQRTYTHDESMRATITFDSIDLNGKSNRTLKHTSSFDFFRFELVNTTAAAARGFLAPEDVNCATSKPNTIHSTSFKPGIFRSNGTALAAHNISQFFDFTGFSIKPLGPIRTKRATAYINAWEIEEREAKNVYSLTLSWGGLRGYVIPIQVSPQTYFPQWGRRVNWVEIWAKAEDGQPLDFCLDDLTFEFSKVKNTKSGVAKFQ